MVKTSPWSCGQLSGQNVPVVLWSIKWSKRPRGPSRLRPHELGRSTGRSDRGQKRGHIVAEPWSNDGPWSNAGSRTACRAPAPTGRAMGGVKHPAVQHGSKDGGGQACGQAHTRGDSTAVKYWSNTGGPSPVVQLVVEPPRSNERHGQVVKPRPSGQATANWSSHGQLVKTRPSSQNTANWSNHGRIASGPTGGRRHPWTSAWSNTRAPDTAQ